jgi:hypothetical protein
MIKLKNGSEIAFDKDFDQFFKNLLEAIIGESRKTAESGSNKEKGSSVEYDTFLKELMDNCIYVTHQLFEIAEVNKDLSKFMVTGFLFNSIILHLPFSDAKPGEKTSDIIH